MSLERMLSNFNFIEVSGVVGARRHVRRVSFEARITSFSFFQGEAK